MAKYFNYFPKTSYTFDGTNIQYVTNLLSKVSFESDFKENSVIYYEYLVSDGETPEIVAHKIYGSAEKHWIILMLNDILHPQFDWPLNESSLLKYIDVKYRQSQYANSSTKGVGTTWAQTNVKEYHKIQTKTNTILNQTISVDTLNVTQNDYANVATTSTNYTLSDNTTINISVTKDTLSYYDYEIAENENKRSIKILKPDFVPVVEQEFIGVFTK
jgi:hypothetical protein